MVDGLIGRKLGMSQINDETGRLVPVTVLRAGPCIVVQHREAERDGYTAVQIGLLEEGIRKANRPDAGHLQGSGVEAVRMLREFASADPAALPDVGTRLDVGLFENCDKVDVVGRSRGAGFAGVVKRYGFGGGRATHGSMFHRAPGSIGCSATPSRVYPGTKMPGRMGNERVTVRNMAVIRIDKEKNLILVRGAVPGPPKGLVLIRKSRTAKKPPAGG